MTVYSATTIPNFAIILRNDLSDADTEVFQGEAQIYKLF